jgi:hypothetical protein
MACLSIYSARRCTRSRLRFRSSSVCCCSPGSRHDWIDSCWRRYGLLASWVYICIFSSDKYKVCQKFETLEFWSDETNKLFVIQRVSVKQNIFNLNVFTSQCIRSAEFLFLAAHVAAYFALSIFSLGIYYDATPSINSAYSKCTYSKKMLSYILFWSTLIRS